MVSLAGLLGTGPAHAEIETITYLHTDHLGSPILARDQAGNTLWQEDYGPWGEPLTAGPGTTGDVGYTGHYSETELNLTYAGARWYDPEVGRFLSPDAVGDMEGGPVHFNRYVYGANSPYRFLDPDGKESQDAVWAALGEANPNRALVAGSEAVGDGAAAVGDVIEPDAMSVIPVAALLKKLSSLFRYGDEAARASDRWTREPSSLQDEMTLAAAQQGADRRIIPSLNDPKFKGMEK